MLTTVGSDALDQLTRRLEELGTRLEDHREHVDDKFESVTTALNGLRTELRVSEAARLAIEAADKKRTDIRTHLLSIVSTAAFVISCVVALVH